MTKKYNNLIAENDNQIGFYKMEIVKMQNNSDEKDKQNLLQINIMSQQIDEYKRAVH